MGAALTEPVPSLDEAAQAHHRAPTPESARALLAAMRPIIVRKANDMDNLVPRDEIEDVVHEVSLRLLAVFEAAPPRTSASGLVRMATRNYIIDHYQRAVRPAVAAPAADREEVDPVDLGAAIDE